MTRHRWGAALLVAATLVAASCGRGDDSSDTTAAPATTTAATTAAPATTASSDTTAAGSATTAAGTAAPAATTAAPTTTEPATPEGYALTAADIADECASEPLEATETGVSESEITIEVMADTGSQLSPGFGQGSVNAVEAFADWINANGGVGCRQLVVRTWDSKFDPVEVKNGQIDSCDNALAMVGNYSVLNPDPSPMEGCVDQAGNPTGLPNVAGLVVDGNENCSPMTIGANSRPEPCPLAPNTDREFVRLVGPATYFVERSPDQLHGVYMANGDLPSTKLSAVPEILALEDAGIVWDATLTQSARDEQSAYIPRTQPLKDGANFVWHPPADYGLVFWMRESIAQGVDMSAITWVCGVACYTTNLTDQGDTAVEGLYLWIPFLPFEEADTNEALNAYVTEAGARGKLDYNGAQSWQAAIAFQNAVNQVVKDQGPNAITRASLLAALQAMDSFSFDGITGPRGLTDPNPCYVMMQVRDGAFERVWPEERGTIDCAPENLGTVTANPEQDVDSVITG